MSFCIIDGFDNRLLGEKLLLLLKKFPAVLMNQATDVMEFIYITSNIYGRQDFYGNLVFYQLFFTYECLAKKFVLFMIFTAQALMIIVFRLNNSYYFFFQVYAVGEYSSPMHAPNCSPELVAQYFDALEVVTYEIIGKVLLEEEGVSPKILCHLMSAMAKVSSAGKQRVQNAMTLVSSFHLDG